MAPSKLTITGEGGVGKSTLVKIFFKGNSALDLLQNPLEPTRSVETTIPAFDEKLVLFDVPGQDFLRYITTEKEIFKESDAILLLLDSKKDFLENVDIIEKLIEIRDSEAPDAFIFILFHKIDLLPDIEQKQLKVDIQIYLNSNPINNGEIYRTSIVREYQVELLTIILQAMKQLSEKDSAVKNTLEIIQINRGLFQILQKRAKVSLEDILNATGATSDILVPILDQFAEHDFIGKLIEGEQFYYTLKDAGKRYIQQFSSHLESFMNKKPIDKESLAQINLEDITTNEIQERAKDLIYGFIIMDFNGRVFFSEELLPISIAEQLQIGQKEAIMTETQLLASYIKTMMEFSTGFGVNLEQGCDLEKGNLRLTMIRKQQLVFIVFNSLQCDKALILEALYDWVGYLKSYFKRDVQAFIDQATPENIETYRQYFRLSLNNLVPKLLNEIKAEVQPAPSHDLDYYKMIYIKLDMKMLNNPKLKTGEKEQLKLALFDAISKQNFPRLVEIAKKLGYD